MIEVYVLFGLALAWIIFAVVQDLRTREIANWLNFSLIIFAFGFRFFYSLFEGPSFSFFYQGLIGFGIFFLLGNLFYYGKMFAGGDAKLMIALGAILPYSNSLIYNLKISFWFLTLFLVVGAIYGIVASLYFTIKNFGSFKKEFISQFSIRKKFIIFSTLLACIFLVLSFFEKNFLFLGIFTFVIPYFYLFVKSVDESCMIRKINVKKLTVGDWLYQDVKVNKKLIKANWDGISEEDLKLLQKHKKLINVRYGVQFAPVFLISFVLFIVSVFFDLFHILGNYFGL